MIKIGDNNITVMIGDREISAIYAGDTLIYPNTQANLIGISLDNLTWVTDVPASGGTATSANCSYTVTGYYDNGTTKNITNYATVEGSLVVPATVIETREYIDDLTLTASYSGFTVSDTVGVYQAAYNPAPDYTKEYLAFNITSDGMIKWFCNNSQSTNFKTIQYSTDNGSTWTRITSNRNAPYINVTTGDKVLFKGDNASYQGRQNSIYSCFSGSTAGFELEGNIMSLIDSTNFSGLTSLQGTYTFQYMFAGCTGLTSAQNLVLPATSLVDSCYRYMFRDCRSLTTAPELPATTLVNSCYDGMFYFCQSLITAPDLPATTLASYCYRYMFYYCASLNYIKCLASDLSASNFAFYWVQGVASTGTFVKAQGVSWNTGVSGIPTGWTVQEE